MSFEWDLGTVMFSEYDADGFLGVSFDHYGEQGATSHPAEVHAQAGVYARPRDPDVDASGNVKPGGGANMWLVTEGNTLHAMLSNDPRALPKLPRNKKGGAIFFGDTGKGQLPSATFDGDSGSFTLYVPYAFSGLTPARAMAISVNVENPGSEVIQVIHGSGSSVTFFADGSIALVPADKGASIQVANGGKVTLNGNTVVQGAVLMGNPSAAQPVVLAPPLLGYLVALEAAIVAVAGAIPGTGSAAAAAFQSAMTTAAPLKIAAQAVLTSAA